MAKRLAAIDELGEARGKTQEWADYCAEYGWNNPEEYWNDYLDGDCEDVDYYLDHVEDYVVALEELATLPFSEVV